MRAYQRALISGTQLRLVVTAPIVQRVLSVNGLDRLIPIYPSLEAAIAAGTPAPPAAPQAAGPPVRPPGRPCPGTHSPADEQQITAGRAAQRRNHVPGRS